MKLVRCESYEDMSARAAEAIAGTVRLKPDCVLGLATGSTPLGLYEELAARYEAGELSFAAVRTVNLDEYVGLGPDHPQSYRYFMDKNLFSRVDIDPANTHLPDGLAPDPDAEAGRYEELLEALGGVDLQVLGLGHNGHIGFNEPDSVFPVRTHLTRLSDSTVRANARFFTSPQEVPRRAFTMGVGSIMRARRILLLVSGGSKAEILRDVLTGQADPRLPASALLLHRHVTVMADRDALRCLP